ncbi:MAG: hypothetical protein HY696_01945 [Deltaproteobacteria bacterium]|nr:hypothetical protein [Deltaproteobacteria bacterium]
MEHAILHQEAREQLHWHRQRDWNAREVTAALANRWQRRERFFDGQMVGTLRLGVSNMGWYRAVNPHWARHILSAALLFDLSQHDLIPEQLLLPSAVANAAANFDVQCSNIEPTPPELERLANDVSAQAFTMFGIDAGPFEGGIVSHGKDLDVFSADWPGLATLTSETAYPDAAMQQSVALYLLRLREIAAHHFLAILPRVVRLAEGEPSPSLRSRCTQMDAQLVPYLHYLRDTWPDENPDWQTARGLVAAMIAASAAERIGLLHQDASFLYRTEMAQIAEAMECAGDAFGAPLVRVKQFLGATK